MSETEHEFRESDVPDLNISDRLHLQRQYNLFGRERVLGWLRSKVALPTRLELAKLEGENVDEDGYYEALIDHYVETDK